MTRASVRTPVGQSAAVSRPHLDRAALTRLLQRQLRRVGCYGGAVSGVWSPSTRRGMKAFNDRVNASLPVEEPDQILLAMLQNHEGKACGPACPQGQSLADGRCLPSAMVARAAGKHAPHGIQSRRRALYTPASGTNGGDTRAVAVTPETTVAERPIDGRMALAGPKAEAPSGAASPNEAAAPRQARGKHGRQRKARTVAPRHSSNRRRMGAWIFHDAPVDRLLAR